MNLPISIPPNPLRPQATRFAQKAVDYVKDPKSIDPELAKKNCWEGAIEVAFRAKAITEAGRTALLAAAKPNQPHEFIGSGARINNSSEALAVPPGNFYILLRDSTPAGGPQVLSHVMISLGGGGAIGTNNGGIGGSPGWAWMNLGGLSWSGGKINGVFELYARDISDMPQPGCIVM